MDHIVPGPIVFRGKTYRSVDEMPAKVRQAYEQVLRMLDDLAPISAPEPWVEWGPGEELDHAPWHEVWPYGATSDFSPRRRGNAATQREDRQKTELGGGGKGRGRGRAGGRPGGTR